MALHNRDLNRLTTQKSGGDVLIYVIITLYWEIMQTITLELHRDTFRNVLSKIKIALDLTSLS